MGIYQTLAELENRGGAAALATVIRTQGAVPRRAGSKMIIFPDGRIDGTIGGGEMESRVIAEALESLGEGVTRTIVYSFRDPEKGDVGVCGGEVEVFIEPIKANETIVIAGGGHVGKAIVHLAKWLGFRVVVADDRTDFATPENLPDADAHFACSLKELPEHVDIHGDTYLVLTTRGVDVDVDGLPALLETSAAYIGVIGSRRRWETTVKALLEQGVPEDKIARVTSPIGLELNAETPEEIAVSVLAQIIMLRRGGTGETMAYSPKGPRKGKGR
ncbi:MAG: XdhC family protein [Anaerolineales bacterium]|nr:XdhC family protein [Anaerolineales bacterium]MCK5634680.1 XdhC family protein [Anaerolineales bacterium]